LTIVHDIHYCSVTFGVVITQCLAGAWQAVAEGEVEQKAEAEVQPAFKIDDVAPKRPAIDPATAALMAERQQSIIQARPCTFNL